MGRSSVIDLKVFLPAKDHALSRQFYLDLGFKLNWGDDQTVEFEIGAFRFLLQNFYMPAFAEGLMMHLLVDNADDWWQQIEVRGLKEKYPSISVAPPTLQPWGLRVLYLTDPSGVLWHIADERVAG
jgi:Glyoxalase/Bleomycin resistance protein/Dioxygenase superfamily